MWKPNAPKMASILGEESGRIVERLVEDDGAVGGDGLILVDQLIAQCGGETKKTSFCLWPP